MTNLNRQSGIFIPDRWQLTYEMVVPQGDRLVQYHRHLDHFDDAAEGFPWYGGTVLPGFGGADIPGLLPKPIAVSLIHSELGTPSDLEAIVRMRPALADRPGGDFLVFYFYDGESSPSRWDRPFDVVADGQPITGVTGNPALIQSTFGRQGNFELVVPHGNRLVHYSRDNDAQGFPWHRSGAVLPGFGGADIPGLEPKPIAVSLLQSNLAGSDKLEAIVRMRPALADRPGGDFLAYYFFDVGSPRWHGPFEVSADGQPITGVTGNPALIQSTFGRQGNFELVVPHGNRLVHYFRDNDAQGFPWHRSGAVIPGFGGADIPGLEPKPIAVSLFVRPFADAGNLDAIVRMRPALADRPGGDFLAYYFFDGGSLRWHGPFEVRADGQLITVTGF